MSIVIGDLLGQEYRRQVALGDIGFARELNVVGGKIKPGKDAIAQFRTLMNALQIPMTFNGTDLILGIVIDKQVRPHVTVEGELAVAIRDPRELYAVITDADHKVGEGGASVVVRTTLRYRGPTRADGERVPQEFSATDTVFLSDYHAFMGRMEQAAADLAMRRLLGKSDANTTPSFLTSGAVKEATDFLTNVQKQLNRGRAFALRTARTHSLRLALREARGRLPIVPMAGYDLLERIELSGRADLCRVMLGTGYSELDIIDLADGYWPKHIQTLADIPDDGAECTTFYRKVVMGNL